MIEKDSQFTQDSIISTEDGSQTLVSPIFHERYHSIYGAQQESQTVFIDAGLKDRWNLEEISVLEMGFGTGLNALMSYNESQINKKRIHYTGYEKYPVTPSIAKQIHYGELFNLPQVYEQLHEIEWGLEHQLSTYFQFTKIQNDILTMSDKEEYDVVYFDAFAPNAQIELWSVEIFTAMYESLRNDGVLVTYCAKGQVKRNLKAAGFIIEALPGPPGKREMTRARKL